nr:acyl-CoA--sterol O-acyltransferase 1-like [Ipomoea trifida]
MMEGEIKSFMVVWSTVLGCLCYCHAIGKLLLPKPTITRALSLVPVACLFMVLPLNLHSINLGATSSFFIAWLASFKVLLFAFGHGPLASSPPLPLSSFLLVACLPIKFQSLQHEPSSSESKKAQRSSVNHLTKLMLLLILFLAVAAAVRAGTGMEMEPPFDEPHLATSLQDFWGRRWNLIVSNILRPTVYVPVKSAAGRVLPGKWAMVTAVMATFVVSGVMHELVFYNIGRVRPSGEVLGFFVLHGACLGVEIRVKKWLKGRVWVPGFVSGPLALCFVIVTSFWLFFPPFLKNKADVKVCTEFLAFVESVKHHTLRNGREVTSVDLCVHSDTIDAMGDAFPFFSLVCGVAPRAPSAPRNATAMAAIQGCLIARTACLHANAAVLPETELSPLVTKKLLKASKSQMLSTKPLQISIPSFLAHFALDLLENIIPVPHETVPAFDFGIRNRIQYLLQPYNPTANVSPQIPDRWIKTGNGIQSSIDDSKRQIQRGRRWIACLELDEALEVVSFAIDGRDLLDELADDVRAVSRLYPNGCSGGLLIIGRGLDGNLEGSVFGKGGRMVIVESVSDCSGGCGRREEEGTSHWEEDTAASVVERGEGFHKNLAPGEQMGRMCCERCNQSQEKAEYIVDWSSYRSTYSPTSKQGEASAPCPKVTFINTKLYFKKAQMPPTRLLSIDMSINVLPLEQALSASDEVSNGHAWPSFRAVVGLEHTIGEVLEREVRVWTDFNERFQHHSIQQRQITGQSGDVCSDHPGEHSQKSSENERGIYTKKLQSERSAMEVLISEP